MQQCYSLSIAHVPNQAIANGRVIIKVVEGFVAHVKINDKIAKDALIKSYIKRLVAQKPVTSEALESFLLRINDLGGHNFRGILSSAKGTEEGGMELTLHYCAQRNNLMEV